MDSNTLMQKAAFWKKLGIAGVVAAIAAAAFSFFAFHKAKVYTEQAMDMQKTSDVVDVAGKSKPRGSIATEAGWAEVEHVRDGKVIWKQEMALNALADEGESFYLDCIFRATNCPTAFTMSLLSTTASPGESSTWSALSTYELVNGTSNGYSAISMTRDNNASTGWPTLDTSAASPCTESSCGRISSAQQTITAGGNWSVGARYLVIRATVGGNQKLLAYAQLSADRTLQSGDQLNLTYRQLMQ
jgi:hypothetical protein